MSSVLNVKHLTMYLFIMVTLENVMFYRDTSIRELRLQVQTLTPNVDG